LADTFPTAVREDLTRETRLSSGSTLERNTYHVLDARNIDSLFARSGECIDVTITSPPYWNTKDYGSRGQIGFGQSYHQYLADTEDIFRKVYDATKRTGTLWMISDTLKIDGELRLLPFDLADRLRRSGWILQDIIIWQKDRTLPWSYQGKLRNIFEYITCFSKSRRFKYHVDRVRAISDLKDYWVRYPERYNPQGKAPSRSWDIAIPRQGSWGEASNYLRHACPLPIELVERILRLASDPGDLVLDPFAGSGTVLATANALNRDFVGVDLSSHYRDMFVERVLPAVRRRFASHITTASANVEKAQFATNILALRALKYPKELLRLYKNNHGDVKVRSVWVIPDRAGRKVTLVFDLHRDMNAAATFLQRCKQLSSVKPLSKFGLDVELVVTRGARTLRAQLKRLGLSDRSRISRYADGRFHWWQDCRQLTAQLTALGIVALAETAYPPILSRLRVRLSATGAVPTSEHERDAEKNSH
jgi:DNA modification methylase